MLKSTRLAITTVGAILFGNFASADDVDTGSSETPVRADGHAPIEVMADHTHKRGQWMFSYRFMYMEMQGNRIGTNNVSPNTIVTTIPNRFFGLPAMPATLRVVPTKMTTEMHMFSGMFAPTDWLTLMLMTSYLEKKMEHTTYAGASGTGVLGRFTTQSDGIGDTKFTGLMRLLDTQGHQAHLQVGVSIPTGSTDEIHTILTPLGATPNSRLPYAMQLGTGTVDMLPGVTYTGRTQALSWGAQYVGEIRTERDNSYRWDNKHTLTGWLGYQPRARINASIRMEYETIGRIKGIDPNIMAPVQTANPNNYGGDKINLAFGINLAGQHGWLRHKRIAIELSVPIIQDLNGPQMESDFMLTGGIQMLF